MVGVWFGIVTCGGIGTEGNKNIAFSGGGGLHGWVILCGAWCGVEFLAGKKLSTPYVESHGGQSTMINFRGPLSHL